MHLAPPQGQTLTHGNESSRGHQAGQAFGVSWRSWACSAWRKDGYRGSHCYLQLLSGVIEKTDLESSWSCTGKGLNSVWMQRIIFHHEGDQAVAQEPERPRMSFLGNNENPAEQGRPRAPWPDFDFGLALSRGWARGFWRALPAWIILCIRYLCNALCYG